MIKVFVLVALFSACLGQILTYQPDIPRADAQAAMFVSNWTLSGFELSSTCF